MAGAQDLFLDFGVKIMRATFRVHKYVINDNKKNTLILID